MEYIYHYDSPLGGITIASDGDALTGLWFDGQKYFAEGLDREYEERALPVFEQTGRWLDQYFGGLIPEDVPPLRLNGTPFQRAVWRRLLGIPYGRTVTYGELFTASHGRSELVATFLAVLELVKGKRVRIEGDGDDAVVSMIEK